MVTREWDPSDSWPHHRQDTSPAASGITDNDRHLASGEALDEAAYLAEVAEAALAPDQADAAKALRIRPGACWLTSRSWKRSSRRG